MALLDTLEYDAGCARLQPETRAALVLVNFGRAILVRHRRNDLGSMRTKLAPCPTESGEP
jgi:hypothetical protein